jgi:hypothetical protein
MLFIYNTSTAKYLSAARNDTCFAFLWRNEFILNDKAVYYWNYSDKNSVITYTQKLRIKEKNWNSKILLTTCSIFLVVHLLMVGIWKK